MQSKFILGLLNADAPALAQFIAVWDNVNLFTVIKDKGQDVFENIVNKKVSNHLQEQIKTTTKALKEVPENELRLRLIIELVSYFNIKLPKQINLYSLEDIGLQIEKQAIIALKNSDSDFKGDTTNKMVAQVFKTLFDKFSNEFEDKDDEEQEKIINTILSSIQEMSEKEREKLKEELKVDDLSAEVIRKALIAGTLGTAFTTLISVAGFSAYTTATAALASIAALIGVTLPFSAYTFLTSLIALLTDPLFLITIMLFFIYGLNRKSNLSIRDGLSPIIVSLISVLSVESDDYLCKSDKLMRLYNQSILKYNSDSEEDKKYLQTRIPSMSKVKFSKESIFDTSIVPDSLVVKCDDETCWLNETISTSSKYDEIKKYFTAKQEDSKYKTDFFIGTLTIGDLIYDMSRVDPLVVEAVDFARKDAIVDQFGLAYFSQTISNDSIGDISQLKGYVAERLVAQTLQSQGYEVEFPETSNQAGYDLLISGKEFQVKCGDSPSLVNNHFDKYPDIPVLVNEELGESFIDNELVFPVAGVRNDTITKLTEDNLLSAREMLDYEIPLWTISVVSAKNLFKFFQNKTDIENAIGNSIEESTSRIAGAFVGSKVLMVAGLVWMPAAGVIGGVVGTVLGSMTMNSLVEKLKVSMILKDETNAISDSIRAIINTAIPIAERNIEISNKKFSKTIEILKKKNEENVIKYIEYRYGQELKYRTSKINFMKKISSGNPIILDDDKSSILVAAQNVLILTEQAGVHPYSLNSETDDLIEKIELFQKAMSASQITKVVKEYIDGESIEIAKRETENFFKKMKQWIEIIKKN